MNSATTLAHSIIRQLIECGVSDFVLSPGSRNAPLSIALHEAAQRNLIELHIKIDERGAAFYALGLAKASDNYVAVICTSGTAAANFHPAAIEALHSQSNLLIITADRPAKLRKTGANQTTNQVNLFQSIPTHDFATSIEIAHLLSGGPVHLNPQFEEPLISENKIDWLNGLHVTPITKKDKSLSKLEVTSGVLIIGHDRGGFPVSEILSFAKKLNWPVIAEDPISFPNAVAHSSLFLADEVIRKALAPENVIVIGRTTLSRSTNSFIALAKKVIVIDPRVTTIDSNRSADQLFSALPIEVKSELTDSKRWQIAAESAANVLENLAWSEQQAIVEIVEQIPDEAALYVGSSRPIRDIEAFVHPRSGVTVFANRGLAGIDGNISTIFGVADKFENTYAILGDLTFLHDISALVNKSKQKLRIFVIDNNGGGIFSTLPQAKVEGFEELFGTPHNLDLVDLVQGFGIEVAKVANLAELHGAISKPLAGLDVVIVQTPNRERNAQQLAELTHKVSNAVRIGINLA
jgi:2-succinyl-5-enolpyruvyl-6-hydroxy-3-cyclohexene-1-carboxylate synthase